MRLQPTSDGFVIDAVDLAPLLDLTPAEVPQLMRDGQITSLSEAGQGTDAGRFRVSFRHGEIRVRFTVDQDGEVLSRTRTRLARRPGNPPGTPPNTAKRVIA